VLFLDEIALFGAHSLDALRGPLEDGTVRIARAGGVVCYPCRFSLVAAMNPCPCGHLYDPSSPCRCDPYRIERYRARLSGPLLDRFDVKVNCERVGKDVLLGGAHGESSEAIRSKVSAARAAQTQRYSSSAITNSSAPRAAIEDCVYLSATARSYLSAAIDALVLSGRGLDRVKRIARTIADLEGCDSVSDDHVGEALSHRLRSDGDGES
jgi:magnesium chelatase family protein